jgi:hypothetical protein
MNVSPSANSIMRAAVFHGHERITIERVAMPEVAVGEVLVRVSRTALCGSDFKLWHKGAEFTADTRYSRGRAAGPSPAWPAAARFISPSLRLLRRLQARRPRCAWKCRA